MYIIIMCWRSSIHSQSTLTCNQNSLLLLVSLFSKTFNYDEAAHASTTTVVRASRLKPSLCFHRHNYCFHQFPIYPQNCLSYFSLWSRHYSKYFSTLICMFTMTYFLQLLPFCFSQMFHLCFLKVLLRVTYKQWKNHVNSYFKWGID